MTKAGTVKVISKGTCTDKESAQSVVETLPKDIEKRLQVVLRHIEESAAFDGIYG